MVYDMKLNTKVVISGRVQGVWFRQNTKNKAEQLGVKGWVKNTDDGNVEAVFEGEEDAIGEMIKWCHHGPKLAKVTNIETTQSDYKKLYKDFRILY